MIIVTKILLAALKAQGVDLLREYALGHIS